MCLKPLAMETDEDRQQDPEMFEGGETPPSSSPEPRPISPQSDEEQQLEHRLSSPEKILFDLKYFDLKKVNSKLFADIPANIQLFHFHKKRRDSNVNVSRLKTVNSALVNHPFSNNNYSQISLISQTSDIKDFFQYFPDAFIERWLKFFFQKRTSCCHKIKWFYEIMWFGSNIEPKLSIDRVYAGPVLKRFLEQYNDENGEIGKQYAFAILFLKNCQIPFPAVHPEFGQKFTRHSEEILLEQITKYLEEMKDPEVELIFIYTYNSPCLRRNGGKYTPCMCQILHKATQWQSTYGTRTVVAFTEYWGLGRKFLDNIMCSNSLGRPELDWCVETTNVEFVTPMSVKYDLTGTLHQFKSTLANVNLTGTPTNDEMVKQFTNEEKENITNIFNEFAVKLFVRDLEAALGNRSPLSIYQVVENSDVTPA